MSWSSCCNSFVNRTFKFAGESLNSSIMGTTDARGFIPLATHVQSCAGFRSRYMGDGSKSCAPDPPKRWGLLDSLSSSIMEASKVSEPLTLRCHPPPTSYYPTSPKPNPLAAGEFFERSNFDAQPSTAIITSDPTYTHSLRFYTKADGAYHPLSTCSSPHPLLTLNRQPMPSAVGARHGYRKSTKANLNLAK